jgi:uncharacterized repeat protein (TIGR02543 family)
MAFINESQWRKAYMIEFLRNKVVEDVFTFSVPPESENLDFPQRVTETPTFGGVVFDDYGNDTVKIRLTGSTINEERKLIYQGNKKLPSYLTGEKEIFKLQELFEKWGEFDNIPDKKVYIYDLSKMSMIQIMAGSPARNYWRMVHKGLKIKRAKDKPFTYNYELEITGVVDKEGKPDPLFGSKGLGDFLDGCQKVVETIETVMEIYETMADTIDTFTQQLADVKKYADDLQNGNSRQTTEGIMRKLPGGNNLWNAAKALMSTASQIRYLAGEGGSSSGSSGSSNYSRDDIFVISFNSGAGSYVAPIQVNYGNYAEKPDDPTLQKYQFMGWFTDEEFTDPFVFETTEITHNITLYAKWEQTQATVTFNSRQGTAVQSETVNIGDLAIIPDPAPTRNGYAFEFWCTDSAATEQFDFSTPITGDLTLYAQWRIVYTVNFNPNGGSPVDPQTVNVGGKVVYPVTPIRENYLFAMWCIDPDLTAEYNFNSPVNSNMTLYAKWTRITNNVSFESNGGSPVVPQEVTIGDYATKPPDPAKDGNSFMYWCSDAGLTQEFLFASTPVNYPMTLYARWAVNVLTITFNANGGSDVEDQLVEYNKLAVYPPIPSKDGALFYRWCVDSELTMEFDFSTPITENMTLYAAWHGGA